MKRREPVLGDISLTAKSAEKMVPVILYSASRSEPALRTAMPRRVV